MSPNQYFNRARYLISLYEEVEEIQWDMHNACVTPEEKKDMSDLIYDLEQEIYDIENYDY